MKKIKQLYRYTDEVLTDAFNRVVVEVYMLSKKNGYKSFAVCGTEQKVGTTSVAINLAIAMARAGWKTLLIDADMHKKNKRLNDNVEAGLAEYLLDRTKFEEVCWNTEYSKLDYIPGGVETENPISLLCSNKLVELLAYIDNQYDYVIWDLPSVNQEVDAKIVCAKTKATILVSAQYASKSLLKDSKRMIEEAGGNVVGVIANKVEQSEYYHYRKVKKVRKDETGGKQKDEK